MAVRSRTPALSLRALFVSRGEDVAQLELEKDMPIDRIVASRLGPADRPNASSPVGDLLRAPGHVEFTLPAFIVFDAAVKGIAPVAPKIGRLR